MNDRDRIGGRFALAVRQSDLHLVSAKRGQRHLAAWFKDLVVSPMLIKRATCVPRTVFGSANGLP